MKVRAEVETVDTRNAFISETTFKGRCLCLTPHRHSTDCASEEEKVTGAGLEPVTAATAVKKLVTKLQMLISYRTSNHNIDTVAPLPVAAEPRLPLPFGSGHVLPLPLTGPLGPSDGAGATVAARALSESGQGHGHRSTPGERLTIGLTLLKETLSRPRGEADAASVERRREARLRTLAVHARRRVLCKYVCGAKTRVANAGYEHLRPV
eukprot:scaffold31008_cov73-Phaeocystis_antarctica.AAC.1